VVLLSIFTVIHILKRINPDIYRKKSLTMERRPEYIVLLLLALTVVASGCTGSSNPEQVGAEDRPQQTDTAPPEASGEEPEPAEISLNSLSVPEEVEMGDNFTVEAVFENTGGEKGDFETVVMTRTEDTSSYGNTDSFSSTERSIEGEVGPGEEETFEVSLKAEDVSSKTIKLAGTDTESDLRVVPKKMRIGEEHTTSNQIGITVESVEVVDYYRYNSYTGGERIKEPDSGQYVFASVRTQNKGELPRSLPEYPNFQLVGGAGQYQPLTLLYELADREKEYEGGEVQPGVVREGYVLFKVSEDVTRDNLSVLWNDVISSNEKSVHWTTQ
jgi:hypothetical protein